MKILFISPNYFMALPFFKNSLLGDLFYVTIFFEFYEIVRAWVREKYKVVKEALIFG